MNKVGHRHKSNMIINAILIILATIVFSILSFVISPVLNFSIGYLGGLLIDWLFGDIINIWISTFITVPTDINFIAVTFAIIACIVGAIRVIWSNISNKNSNNNDNKD